MPLFTTYFAGLAAGALSDAEKIAITDAGSLITATEVEGAIQELAASVASVTGSVYFIPVGALTINCSTRAEAVANYTYIQDKFDNYTIVFFPPSGDVTDAFDIADPAALGTPQILNNGQQAYGPGPENCQIRMWAGENMDAVLASRNWVENDDSSPPSGLARNIRLYGIGVDGQHLNRTTGTELQTAGAGHGIALACFTSTVEWCGAAQTRGAGLFIDTTGRDGVTALGEGLETHIVNNVFTRCGHNGVHVADTAAISGGVTDMYLKSNAIAHCNQRGATDDFGTGIFVQSGGGWEITGNHIYGADDFTSGNWAGYGPTQYTHGILVKSAFGTRIIGNQVADFGYHLSDTADAHGISVQLQERRPAVIVGNTIFTDEDNVGDPAIRDIYAIRVTTKANEDSGVTIGNNVTESRRFDSYTLAPTLKGIKLDTATGGTLVATVTGNVLYGVPFVDAFTDNTNTGSVVKATGNSWQPTNPTGDFDVRLYGAVLDGTTDDTTAIQAAVDAAGAAGGGRVTIPGDFVHTGIFSSDDGIHIEGSGQSATIAILGAAAAGSSILLTGDSCSVSKLSINGNKLVATGSSHGVEFRGTRSRLHDVYIYDCDDDGFVIGATADQAHAAQLSNVYIRGCDARGIFAGSNAYDLQASNVWIGDCNIALRTQASDCAWTNGHFWGSTSHGVEVRAAGNRFTSCYAESNGGNGFNIFDGHRTQISGGTVWSNVGDGIVSNSDHSSYRGIEVRNNTGSGIRHYDGDGNTISANVCFDDQGTKTQDYGISLSAAAVTNTAVTGNVTRAADHQTGGLLNSGTGTQLAGNVT